MLHDVLAMIPVLGKRYLLLALIVLEITCLQGKTKFLNLVSRIVNVKFPCDLIARFVKHAGKTVPQSAAPGIAHVQRSRGVCADKLHVDLFALAHIDFPIPLLFLTDEHQSVIEPVGAKVEVQKARSGTFCLFDIGIRKVHGTH